MTTRKKQTIMEETIVGSTDDSPSVIAYRVGQLELGIKEFKSDVLLELKGIGNNFVTTNQLQAAQKSADEKHKEQDARIDKLENSIVWGVRLVVGAVITAVIGLLLKAGGAY